MDSVPPEMSKKQMTAAADKLGVLFTQAPIFSPCPDSEV